VLFLPMDESVQDEMVTRYGYGRAVIPAGTYAGQTEDVASTAQHFVFFTHKDAPEDLVYAMTRLTFENKDDLVAAHSLFEALDRAVGPRDFPIPLHPGAERYYREMGLLD